MEFCANCHYVYDLSNILDDTSKLITISQLLDILKKNPKSLSKYSIKESREELEKNKDFNKIYSKNTENIKKLLNQLFNKSLIGFKCNNCGNIKKIDTTFLLFKEDRKKTSNKLDFDPNILIKDPTLPRTKDYSCKNIKCSSTKNPEIKEAIFIRNKNTYNLTYICTVCNSSW
jgi:hypothetical protein